MFCGEKGNKCARRLQPRARARTCVRRATNATTQNKQTQGKGVRGQGGYLGGTNELTPTSNAVQFAFQFAFAIHRVKQERYRGLGSCGKTRELDPVPASAASASYADDGGPLHAAPTPFAPLAPLAPIVRGADRGCPVAEPMPVPVPAPVPAPEPEPEPKPKEPEPVPISSADIGGAGPAIRADAARAASLAASGCRANSPMLHAYATTTRVIRPAMPAAIQPSENPPDADADVEDTDVKGGEMGWEGDCALCTPCAPAPAPVPALACDCA